MTPIMRPYVIRDEVGGQPVLSAMTMIAESHVSLHVFPARSAPTSTSSRADSSTGRSSFPAARPVPGGSVQEALIARGSRYRYLRTERADEHAKSRTWLPQR